MFRLKLLDRYILGKFLTAFFYVVLLLTLVICVIDYTEKNSDFVRTQPGWKLILGDYFVNFAFYIANMLSPITVFIATVFVTSRLAARTEIIAILAGGVSFPRLMRPYLIGSIIIGVLIYFVNGYVIPRSNKTRVGFELKYIKQVFNYSGRNIHIKVAPETYAYLESYSNPINTGYKFTLETIHGGKLFSKLKSERVVWLPDKHKWRAEDITIRTLDSTGKEAITFLPAADTSLRLTPDDFSSNYLQYETLTTPQLNSFIAELEMRGADNINPYRIERYLRVTYPFAIIILTMIGVIMSARKARGGVGFQIALGFLLAFIYIIAFIMSRSVAQAGSIDPLLACWMPNIIFSAIGLLLYNTVPR